MINYLTGKFLDVLFHHQVVQLVQQLYSRSTTYQPQSQYPNSDNHPSRSRHATTAVARMSPAHLRSLQPCAHADTSQISSRSTRALIDRSLFHTLSPKCLLLSGAHCAPSPCKMSHADMTTRCTMRLSPLTHTSEG